MYADLRSRQCGELLTHYPVFRRIDNGCYVHISNGYYLRQKKKVSTLRILKRDDLLSKFCALTVLEKEDINSNIRTKNTGSSVQSLEDDEEIILWKGKINPRPSSKDQLNAAPSLNEKHKICIRSEDPATEIQDKTTFVINNLSSANIESKSKQLIEILKEQYYSWFSRYIVTKRAKLEPNFQELYLKLVDRVNSKPLNQEILNVTYETSKNVLGSELIKSSVEERSLLNNLGSWLGKITIGRNQALRESEIDPKSLIIEAYEKGSMTAVIPFISKILESAQNSSAYQPLSFWTMDILGLLVEIHEMPNLKMNLIFAIEILFRNLGVNLKEISPTSLLKDKARLVEGNLDFSSKDRRRS